jgi:RNA polymerase sigma factor for flagellar operon FliA
MGAGLQSLAEQLLELGQRMSQGIESVAETELWRRYRRSSDIAARDHLFHLYMPWAAAVGRNVYRRISVYSLDCADFVQNAELGMLDAMTRFDPERGIDFRAFARPRVRGAVFNGLRALLSERGAPNEESRFGERLSHFHHDDDAFDGVVNAIIGLGIGYLLDHAAGERGDDAYAYVKRSQIDTRLSAAVNRLPERLRRIVVAHYFEHVPFTAIAEDMQLTKGRVSQLHHEALTRLRHALRELG